MTKESSHSLTSWGEKVRNENTRGDQNVNAKIIVNGPSKPARLKEYFLHTPDL